jgi:WD40 repeat protein
MEKEMVNASSHRERISGIVDLNELELITCALDKSFKVWDKSTYQCDYTIETHSEVQTMAISGEKKDMFVASLGEGDLIVYKVDKQSQLDIIS